MLTFGTAVEALSAEYETPDAYAEQMARRAFTRAGVETDLVPIDMGRVKTLEGVTLFREHYMFESEGEKWDRIVLSSAFEEEGKVKYLKVVCHFPTEIRSMAVQELGYYTDHMHVNRKPAP